MAYDITRGLKVSGMGESVPRPSGRGIRSVYDSAATTQADDYDNIMRGYDDILNSTKSKRNSGLNYIPISPHFSQYTPAPDYKRSNELNTALTGLEDYSKTGGYSDADIQNIRERSISPIRSIYSSAQEGLRRQKVLQGGYSPNYGAVSAKLNRDAASRIGDITTKANADIAQMIASGKLAGLTGLGNVATQDNALNNQILQKGADVTRQTNQDNTDEARRVDELNKKLGMTANTEDTNTEMEALAGKRSLYGTTPALTQTFANQVLANNQQNMQAVTTANMIKNQRANIGLNLVNSQLGKRIGPVPG